MSEEDETRARPQEALLEDSLAATLDVLGELADSPKVRDLRKRAQTYQQTLARWPTIRPSRDQRDALRDLILDLHQKACEAHASEARTPHLGVPSVRPPNRG